MEPVKRTLMQSRTKAKEGFRKSLAVLLGLSSVGMGIALLWVGDSEKELVTLFFYFVLGFALIFVGGHLINYGLPAKKIGSELEKSTEETTEKTPETQAKTDPTKCQHCGALITSAGKFCGHCGKPLS